MVWMSLRWRAVAACRRCSTRPNACFQPSNMARSQGRAMAAAPAAVYHLALPAPRSEIVTQVLNGRDLANMIALAHHIHIAFPPVAGRTADHELAGACE